MCVSLCPQGAYIDPLFASIIEVNHLLQLLVVREFGLGDSYVRFLRAAVSQYSREELPWEALPNYMRFNRRYVRVRACERVCTHRLAASSSAVSYLE